MINAKTPMAILIFAAFHGYVCADVVTYFLEDMILADGGQITGTFEWTYVDGDFEGGNGEFTALEIPYTVYSFDDGNLNIDIETNAIEISGNGNYHDVGLDITLSLVQPFTPIDSAALDLGLSFFECCGNGFRDQFFQSGRISLANVAPICDFTDDHICSVEDLDLMQSLGPINAGIPAAGNERFDLNGDGSIDLSDREEWLGEAATENNLGSPYKLGDANLDGVVDGLDFIAWNESRFTSNLRWSNGNFDADGFIDGSDFIFWNVNKFTGADSATVPEPGALILFPVALLSGRRRKSGFVSNPRI